MLSIYTRHYPPCQRSEGNYRKCRCPKWINGTLATGQFVRISARTRNWETAERKARIMEFRSDPLQPQDPAANSRIRIEEAVKNFLADEQARKLAKICK